VSSRRPEALVRCAPPDDGDGQDQPSGHHSRWLGVELKIQENQLIGDHFEDYPLQSLPEAMKKARPKMRVHRSRNFMVKLACCTDG